MGLSGSQVPALERSSKPQVLLCKCILCNKTETLLEERKNKIIKKCTYVCYSFIQSHTICQSSFTSFGASGKAAQKQSLLLERTGLVLLCHLEKAWNIFSPMKLSMHKSIRRRCETSDPCRFRPIPAKPSLYFLTLLLIGEKREREEVWNDGPGTGEGSFALAVWLFCLAVEMLCV